jgi:hypothetical protein
MSFVASGGVSTEALRQALREIQFSTQTKKILGFVHDLRTVEIDFNAPIGTASSVEITDSRGHIRPKVFIVYLDYEVSAEIRVVVDGEEVPLVSNIEPPMLIIDVERMYGIVDTQKIIFTINKEHNVWWSLYGQIEYYGVIVEH